MKDMKNKVLKGLCLVAAVSGSTALLSSCGNHDVWDMHYTFNYAVIEENGINVLHKVKSWDDDSESDSFTISTSCCDNYIWTTANKGILYSNKPDSKCYDEICSMLKE